MGSDQEPIDRVVDPLGVKPVIVNVTLLPWTTEAGETVKTGVAAAVTV
jgi:hypothetical protein